MLGTLLMDNGLMVPWAGGLCAGDNQGARISEWYDMVDRGSGMDIVVAFDAWNPNVMFQLFALSYW